MVLRAVFAAAQPWHPYYWVHDEINWLNPPQWRTYEDNIWESGIKTGFTYNVFGSEWCFVEFCLITLLWIHDFVFIVAMNITTNVYDLISICALIWGDVLSSICRHRFNVVPSFSSTWKTHSKFAPFTNETISKTIGKSKVTVQTNSFIILIQNFTISLHFTSQKCFGQHPP